MSWNRDRVGMNIPFFLAAVGNAQGKSQLVFVWGKATLEAKAIIIFLVIFSIMAWSVMIAKAIQMRRAKKLNAYFSNEFRTQKHVLDIFDRRVQAEGCPMFVVYQAGSIELNSRLKGGAEGPGDTKGICPALRWCAAWKCAVLSEYATSRCGT